MSSPKANAVVNGKTVTINGQTQARSTVSAANAATNGTVSGAADGKGAFTVVVPLGTGSNTIQITATDPAGNANTANLTVRRGTGALTARLAASTYQIKRSILPEPVTLYRDGHRSGRAGAGRGEGDLHPGRPGRAGDRVQPADDRARTGGRRSPRRSPAGRRRASHRRRSSSTRTRSAHTTDRTVITIS